MLERKKFSLELSLEEEAIASVEDTAGGGTSGTLLRGVGCSHLVRDRGLVEERFNGLSQLKNEASNEKLS